MPNPLTWIVSKIKEYQERDSMPYGSGKINNLGYTVDCPLCRDGFLTYRTPDKTQFERLLKTHGWKVSGKQRLHVCPECVERNERMYFDKLRGWKEQKDGE